MPGEIFRALRWASRPSSGLISGPEMLTRQCLARSMATEAQAQPSTANLTTEIPVQAQWPTRKVHVMTYDFLTMEPKSLAQYKENQLSMPLRKDILHRAIVFEGDNTRQGTASAKWRDEVHGSHRKMAPQKGTGRARVGDKQSPIRRGGGVAHGPHPRDFGTDLPRKIYDKAWRIALSYRYKKEQLTVIDNQISVPTDSTPHLMRNILQAHGWDRKHGLLTFITEREDLDLAAKFADAQHVRIRNMQNLDVKNLLETKRLVIEKGALDWILRRHSSDLTGRLARAMY
ncbi:50S ribosomal protein L4 [Penicillium lagena]|uniref:50S ribosomal protein L4 n=1 Tax=Penicillium lagena TaxID=94218 RepID=UPI00254179C8|nr:50S ribosomal protein L4 [Penicillium lagena]KAJ5620208.1 50S ribosomal protein L4 [Penicillium lagena]